MCALLCICIDESLRRRGYQLQQANWLPLTCWLVDTSSLPEPLPEMPPVTSDIWTTLRCTHAAVTWQQLDSRSVNSACIKHYPLHHALLLWPTSLSRPSIRIGPCHVTHTVCMQNCTAESWSLCDRGPGRGNPPLLARPAVPRNCGPVLATGCHRGAAAVDPLALSRGLQAGKRALTACSQLRLQVYCMTILCNRPGPGMLLQTRLQLALRDLHDTGVI